MRMIIHEIYIFQGGYKGIYMNNSIEKFSLEDNKKQKKKSKKTYGIISLFFFLLVIIFLIINNIDTITNLLKKPKEKDEIKITLSLNDIKYELGTKIKYDKELYVNNEIDLDELDISFESVIVDEEGLLNKVGEYEYEVNYAGIKGKGKIKVSDSEPPKVKTKIAYIPFGSQEIDADMFIKSVVDNSKNYVAEITNLQSINPHSIGEIEVKLTVKDLSDNKVEVTSKLVVLESTYAELFSMQDLNVSYNDKDDKLWNNVITEKFESAITSSSSIFLSGLNKVKNYNWDEIINTKYPGSIVEESDSLILYNQDDLIVGITKRVKLKFNNESKYYYLEY